MKSETFMIHSKCDDLPLSVLSVVPDQAAPKAIFQIVHGMAEMKERYLDFMTFLAENGYACIIHDHRGHGRSVRSEEDLGYMYGAGAEGLVEDAHLITEEAKKRWPDIPVILMGHSMGSLVVRCYVRKYDQDIDRLIVMGSPAQNKAVGFAKALAGLVGLFKGSRHKSSFINNAAFGSYLKGIENPQSEYDWLSLNRDNVHFYLENKYCGFIFTIDGFKALFGVLEDTYKPEGWQMKNPELPILFLSGEKDPCINGEVNFKKAMNFMKERGYRRVDGKLYENLRHEILNEDSRQDVYDDILKWLANN